MDIFIYPLAFLVGILFNLNPSCGSATVVWASTQRSPLKLALLGAIRILVFALVGASAGYFGTALRLPWGIMMIAAGLFLFYTTVKQVRAGTPGVCALPRQSAALPWVLALTPPPSAYIGLALFFGGFNAPSAAEGALVLTMVGLGLTLPVWLIIFKPGWWTAWQMRLQENPRTARTQVVFQFVGVGLLVIVGTAFLVVQDFHRPLLELL
ncbi:MAG: hypothetical protein ACYCZY_07175 [Lacisediminihabitans sp.]